MPDLLSAMRDPYVPAVVKVWELVTLTICAVGFLAIVSVFVWALAS